MISELVPKQVQNAAQRGSGNRQIDEGVGGPRGKSQGKDQVYSGWCDFKDCIFCLGSIVRLGLKIALI